MRRDVFQAISDPTRREIITLLSRQELNLNSIAEQFKISRPAISRHIKILSECGLVSIKVEGREHYCRAQLGSLRQVSDWANLFQHFWECKLNSLEEHLKQTSKSENKKHKNKSSHGK